MDDLKEAFGNDVYNALVKCNFIKDIKEILDEESLINIDLHDIKTVAKGEIVGAISQTLNSFNDKLIMNKISDKTPTDCLLNIVSDINISLKDIDTIVNNIRLISRKDINIIYGTKIVDDIIGACKVQALFSYNADSKDNN